MSRAAQLIEQLRLQPHPEGGWYREVFRSSLKVQPQDGRSARQALTAIYFLLEAGRHSRWHQVASDEAWVHLEGLPVDLWTWDPSAPEGADAVLLGPVGPSGADGRPGIQPQHVVAAGLWQAARPRGSSGFSLVACTVGPGFDFSDFRMMQAGGAEALLLQNHQPELAAFV